MGAGASSAAAGADAQAGRRAPAPAPATEPATAAGRAASAPAAAGATAAGTGASEGRASRGAGRQRLAYRGPTLGGALGGARPAAPGALSAQGAPAREPPRAPAVPAQAQTQALHAGAAHLRAPRGRSTLVTAGGLVNSSDIDSIVKQRRHAKKVPSAASLQAEERTERPGAYALVLARGVQARCVRGLRACGGRWRPVVCVCACMRGGGAVSKRCACPGSAHARLVRSRAAKGDATSRCGAPPAAGLRARARATSPAPRVSSALPLASRPRRPSLARARSLGRRARAAQAVERAA